jgi:hypothetical protein
VDVQRGPTAAAAVARSLRRRVLGLDNTRPWEVQRGLGKLVEWLAGGESARCCKFTGGGGNDGLRLGGAQRGAKGGA